MPVISFKFDVGSYKYNFRRAHERYAGQKKEVFKEAGRELLNYAKEITPEVTGATRAAWDERENTRTNEITIFNTSKVIRFLDTGVRPHMILPVSRKALKFVANDMTVFSKYAFHPGFRGLNILEQLEEHAHEVVPAIFDKHYKR